jgi:hypothetical protein
MTETTIIAKQPGAPPNGRISKVRPIRIVGSEPSAVANTAGRPPAPQRQDDDGPDDRADHAGRTEAAVLAVIAQEHACGPYEQRVLVGTTPPVVDRIPIDAPIDWAPSS